MLMIRLQRVGRRHDPSYRVVVTEKASGPRAGKSVENLGHYDARLHPGGSGEAKRDLQIDVDRVKYWLSVGAKASGTMHNLLVRESVVSGKKRDVRPRKNIKVQEPALKEENPKEEKVEEVKEEPKVGTETPAV